jgi:hypothetical protein
MFLDVDIELGLGKSYNITDLSSSLVYTLKGIGILNLCMHHDGVLTLHHRRLVRQMPHTQVEMRACFIMVHDCVRKKREFCTRIENDISRLCATT